MDDAIVWRPVTTGFYAGTSDVTLEDSDDEEDITAGGSTGSTTLPAGALQVGRTVRIKAAGFASGANLALITFRVRLGGISGTVVGTAGPIDLGTAPSNIGWSLEATITSRSYAMGGSVHAQGHVLAGSASGVATTTFMVNTSTISLDTTAAQEVVITGRWSNQTPSNTITTTHTTIEQVY